MASEHAQKMTEEVGKVDISPAFLQKFIANRRESKMNTIEGKPRHGRDKFICLKGELAEIPRL